MDYAFAPGVTDYDHALNNMLAHRASTTLVNSPFTSTIGNLVSHLSRHVPPNPLTHIVIGTHGDDNAYMQIQLHGGFGPNTTYEDMVQEMSSTPRRCQIADNVVNPRPVDSSNQPITCFILIKGCLIGKSLPFLNKLKDVVNGLSSTTIQIAAPRFFHAIKPLPQGTFEFFCYHFEHFSKTRVANKTVLAALMVAKGFRDIHGTAIPDAAWNRWIPRNIHQIQQSIQRVRLNPTPIRGRSRAIFGRYKYSAPIILSVGVRVTSGSLPTADADRLQLLRADLHQQAANPGTNLLAQALVATHPFPYFRRYDYTDLDNMIDNLDWRFNPQDAQTMQCVGRRHQYNVNPPVVAAANNDLIFNYYANNTHTTSSSMFTDTDARFFQTA